MAECLDKLEQMQEKNPTVFPKLVIQDLWEELHWRFWEELREQLRMIKRGMQRDNPQRQEIAFYACMPGSDGASVLQLPEAFDLDSPTGWFQSAVMPMIERKHQHAMWGLTWDGSKNSRKEKAGGRTKEKQKQAGDTEDADEDGAETGEYRSGEVTPSSPEVLPSRQGPRGYRG